MSEQKIIEIGKTAAGEAVELDLYKFIQTRAMIQASSGGGKSWLARLIEEKTINAGIPVWTIDPEGEYTTLREKFEIVIFGAMDEADLPADEKTLAVVLPELFARSVSVVFDLSENTLEEKQAVSARVCAFLLSIPKPDQKPILLVVDEAQVLAPEREITESGKALSDVASRGRKRGLGLLVATQRLSALNKNLTTQLQNRFVGFCREDIEITRAAELVNKDNARLLPDFEPGDFFAVGGAINSRHVVRFRSGAVETTHPDASVFVSENRLKTAIASEGLTELIATLQEKLAETTLETKPDETGRSDSRQSLEEIKKRESRLIEWERDLSARETQLLEEQRILENFKPLVFEKMETVFAEARELINSRLDNLKLEFGRILVVPHAELSAGKTGEKYAEKMQPEAALVKKNAPLSQKTAAAVKKNGSLNLPPAQQKILDALATFLVLGVTSVERQTVAVFSAQSPKSTAFAAHLRNLVGAGLIGKSDSYYSLTPKGCDYGRANWEEINGNQELLDAWCHYLPAKQGAILRQLAEFYPKSVAREALADFTQQSPKSTAFDGHLRALRSFGLIGVEGSGDERRYFATELLFPFTKGDDEK